jgi:hypothetical protein
MTAEEADHLAKRIINTFRQTPALTEWRQVLTRLDHHWAIVTFEHCRDTITDQLPIATYHAHYRAITTPASGIPTSPDTGPAIPPHIGKRVAWQAYVAEARGQGREPNRTWFNECLEPSST